MTSACFYGEVISYHNCKDSQIDEENCWWNDGCDYTGNTDQGYHCNSTRNILL